ncbi:hypothetical protein N7495_005128 [Penicillium taxi]|uniref:uncharacterized protein n=1 Tax=Penicillium taxi TaxID=168475 RepID=UPI00254575F4|nr:uncharacterized protein N7495_005128 [Penicillium taxi]KAJ5893437.1 hypothetical protein N7495_005128 [Penicillium taxi]
MATMTDPRSAVLVQELPDTMFIEALYRLSPSHFIEPFRELHHPLHSWAVMLQGLKRLEEIFDDFVRNLYTITQYRTADGHALQLAEYTHLLRCAATMGNAPFAEELWLCMDRDRVIPDAICYSHYMEAITWDHCYTGEEQYRLRILHKHYKKRNSPSANIGWQGYGTGIVSVRSRVLRIMDQMADDGHVYDERAYIHLMIASARVGHGPGIRQVLQTVWNIDVDALKEEPDTSRLPPPTPYDPWSSLYPSENLLFAVAHALGTNNDILAAIKTIEFISTFYNIPIPTKVWHELLERSYVLCRTRTTKSRYADDSNNIGKVSIDLVRSVFDTMTSKPYSVTPTLQAWRFMINISIDGGSLEDCKAELREAYRLLTATRKKQADARAVVVRCLKPALDASKAQIRKGAIRPDPFLFQSPVVFEAIHAYDIIRLQVYQQMYLLQRILWVVIRVPHWRDTTDESWFYQERPKLLEEWRDFLPATKKIFYSEDTGDITFHGPTRFRSRVWFSDGNVPVRRNTEHKILFHTKEKRYWPEEGKWNDLFARYPYIDTTIAPLNRLVTFQLPHSKEFEEVLRNFRSTWVDYPEFHPQSTESNPSGGFYGRLAALGMLKPKNRGIYLLDDSSWI